MKNTIFCLFFIYLVISVVEIFSHIYWSFYSYSYPPYVFISTANILSNVALFSYSFTFQYY